MTPSGIAYRFVEVALEMAVHQVGDHFGIGFRSELVTGLAQALAQNLVILDDAIVHYGDTLAGKMRMRVGLGGYAVGCPAGMGYADMAGLIGRDLGVEILHLAQRSEALQLAAFEQRDTRGIVTAVFESMQAFQ